MTTRSGRPPLTEQRKAATRLDIARAAVRLFAGKGVAATTAEEIAAAAGVSLRTLWRYFPTKESCVLPLLTTGVADIAEALRAWPRGADITELAHRLGGRDDTDVPTLLALVRLAQTEPPLRAVWLQVHDDAEPVFAAALAERAGEPAGSLPIRVQAAVVNSALRAAVEHYASHDGSGSNGSGSNGSGEDLLATVRAALLTAAEFGGGEPGSRSTMER